MKPNITPVTLSSEKDKARIMNILFKVKLLVLVGQLVDSLRWNSLCTLFFGNYQSNYSSRLLFLAGSEKLYSEASLLNDKKPSQLWCTLRNRFSKKIENVQGKCQCRCPVSVMLPYGFIKTELHLEYFSRNPRTFWGIFICLARHQIIIVLIRFRKGSCHCAIGKIL